METPKVLIKGHITEEDLLLYLPPLASLYLLNTNLLSTVLKRTNDIDYGEGVKVKRIGSSHLNTLFRWRKTPEGSTYWLKVFIEINKLRGITYEI